MADPLNPGTTIPVGQQSSTGFELSASVRATRALLIQGNYAYTDAQYDDFIENVGGVGVPRDGNRPVGVPVHVGNVWLDATLAPRWQAGADVRVVSARFGTTANSVWAPGYAILGAFVSHEVRRGVQAVARVRNLTDSVYAAAITGTPMFFLGAPRTFEVALKLGF